MESLISFDRSFTFLDHERKAALCLAPPHVSASQLPGDLTDADRSDTAKDECILTILIYAHGPFNATLQSHTGINFDATNPLVRSLLYRTGIEIIASLSAGDILSILPQPYTSYRLEVYHGYQNVEVSRCFVMPNTVDKDSIVLSTRSPNKSIAT